MSLPRPMHNGLRHCYKAGRLFFHRPSGYRHPRLFLTSP
ncbi:hypothetical protein M3J09_004835 [Ascochyta lentis]